MKKTLKITLQILIFIVPMDFYNDSRSYSDVSFASPLWKNNTIFTNCLFLHSKQNGGCKL